MNLSIRKIRLEDLSAVVSMLREFAVFENLSEYCTVTEKRLHNAMFSDGSVVEGLIASDTEKPVAFAIFYPNFSSFRGERGMHLEDIYIRPEYRGKSLGETLLKEIACIASSRGFERIDFQVLDWNIQAIGFYEKLGAVRNDDDRHFKFSDTAFAKLSEPPT